MKPEDTNNRQGHQHPLVVRLVVLAVVSTVVVVSLFAAELVLRHRIFNGYAVWPERFEEIVSPSASMPGVYDDARFSTNKHGIRAGNFSWRDDYRILAIGGSTTECLFLDDSETWTRLLENELNDGLKSTRVWVGNVGKSGHSTLNYIETLTMLVPQFESIDAVIILSGINDLSLFLSRGPNWAQLQRTLKKSPRNNKETFYTTPVVMEPVYRFPELTGRLGILRRKVCGCPEPFKEYAIDTHGTVYDKWRDHRLTSTDRIEETPDMSKALEEYRKNINELIDLAENQGLRVVFVTQPSMWRPNMPADLDLLLWFGGVGNFQIRSNQPYYTTEVLDKVMKGFNRTLKEVCENRKVECIDLASILPKDTTVLYDDCHFNENGARLTARALSNHFLTSEPLRKKARQRD